MDVRRSRLPKNPVNIGRSAQKSAKQGDGPSARGRSPPKRATVIGAPPPAPCKERFLLTILSSRRIRLHPANGSHYAARKTMTTGVHALHPPGQPAAVEMAPAIYSPRSDLLKYPFLYRSGARFCSKGRRMALLPGAARMPIKRKAAQPYFKAKGSSGIK